MKVFDWAESVIVARAARAFSRKLRGGKVIGQRRARGSVLDCGCANVVVVHGCLDCARTYCEFHSYDPHHCPEKVAT